MHLGFSEERSLFRNESLSGLVDAKKSSCTNKEDFYIIYDVTALYWIAKRTYAFRGLEG